MSNKHQFFKDKRNLKLVDRSHPSLHQVKFDFFRSGQESKKGINLRKRHKLLARWEKWEKEYRDITHPELKAIALRLEHKTSRAHHFFYCVAGFLIYMLAHSFVYATQPTSKLQEAVPTYTMVGPDTSKVSVQVPDSLLLISTVLQNINVQGTVLNSCCETPVDSVKVDIYKGNSPVDHTYTDIEGNYSMNFTLTGNNDLETKLESKLYPNPSQGQSNLEIYSKSDDIYKMMITDMSGKTLLNTDVNLNEGNNKITLNGGQAGMYNITLTNGEKTTNQKAIQTTNTNLPFVFNVTQISNPTQKQQKSVLDDIVLIGDEITAQFAKPGFFTSDTTLTVNENNTINKSLTPEPLIVNYSLKVFTVDGLPANMTLSIKWPGMTTFQNHPTNNGIITFNSSVCECTGSIAEYKIDTTLQGNEWLSPWIIIRDPNQASLFLPNIAQSQKEASMPPGTTLVNIFDPRMMNDTSYMYVIPKEVPDPVSGGMVRTWTAPPSSTVFEDMAVGRAPPLGKTTKYSYAPQVTDTLDIVQFTFNYADTSQQIPIADLDRAIVELNRVVNLHTLPNGDCMLPPYQITRVSSLTDPLWQEITNRNGDQLLYTTFNSTTSIGGNGVILTTNNSSVPGEPRIKNSVSKYPNTPGNSSTIFTEILQGMDNIADPVNSGAGGYLIVNGQPTQFGKILIGLKGLLNQGTPYK